jgi:hypothetical protein
MESRDRQLIARHQARQTTARSAFSGSSRMRRWNWIATLAASALAVSVLAPSCGISGKTGGGDPHKSDLTILNLRVVPTDSSAVVTWQTQTQTVGTVVYGAVGGSPFPALRSDPSGDHRATIPDLASNSRYWCQVTAAAPLGASVTSLPDTFLTLVNPEINDSTPPVITGLQVVGITANSATVVWLTDDRTIGQVFYGFSSTYGSTVADSASYIRSHAVTLTDLSENEEYNVRVWAKNRARLTAYSDNLVFHTAEQPTLEVFPDTVSVVGNGDFEFGITLRGAQNIAGLTFMLSYDPSVMEIVSVRKATWFDQTQGHIFINELDDPSLGRTKWDATWTIVFLNGTPVGTLANGGGEVAHIRARAKGPGTSSPLRLVDDLGADGKPETRLLDHNRRDIPFHVRGGVVIKVM